MMTTVANAFFRTGVLLLCAFGAASANAAMRCGTELVYEGDTKQALLDACGQPDAGDADMHTGVLIYRMDGAEYEVHVINDTVERIEGPGMSEDAPLDEDDKEIPPGRF